MSILDVISHALNEHLTRATREGRGVEANFVALVKEIVMSAVADLQTQISGLSGKMSQLEADTAAIIAKVGSGSGAPPPGGPTITQDQVDSMTSAVTAIAGRIDALGAQVVAGTSTPAPTASEPTQPTPSAPSAPLPPGSQDSGTSAAPSAPAPAPAAPAAPTTPAAPGA